MQADVGADVEAAGDVVHGDRRDAGDEQPLDATAVSGARFQGGEEVAVETAAVGEGLIRLLPLVGQDRVGEVVVFVDQYAQGDVVIGGVHEQLVELAVDRRWRQDALPGVVRKQVWVALQRGPEPGVAIGLEAFPQGLRRVVERREVEAKDDVSVTVRRRPPPDVGAGEERLESIGPVAVVVVLQQRHPTGLAETAGTDQKGVALVLQLMQKARLGTSAR